MGKDSEYESPWRVLFHSELRAPDDSRRGRTYSEYFLVGRQESTAERSSLCSFQMGVEWSELLGSGGVARAQHSGFRGLPWVSGYRTKSARGKRHKQNAQIR